jgi:hypothetical protein
MRREATDGESGAEAERSRAHDVRGKRPQRHYLGDRSLLVRKLLELAEAGSAKGESGARGRIHRRRRLADG